MNLRATFCNLPHPTLTGPFITAPSGDGRAMPETASRKVIERRLDHAPWLLDAIPMIALSTIGWDRPEHFP
jgi:hypothetical protein